MKQCPQCKRTSNDDSLAFCLYDGQPLEQVGSPAQASGPPPVQTPPPQGPPPGGYVPSGGYAPPNPTVPPGGYVQSGGVAPRPSKSSPAGWIIAGILGVLIVGWVGLGLFKTGSLGGGGSDQASVVAAVRNADDAEAQAIKSLDTTALPKYYAGGALTQVQSEVESLKQQGVYEDGRLVSSQVQAVAFDGQGKNAAVQVTETWSATFYNAQSNQVVKTVPDQPLPQTIHLQRSDNGWLITQIDNDSAAAAPPGQ